jgi:Flp pilus assembly protein TadD/peroxiredoxin
MEFSRMNSRDRNKHKMLSRRALLKGMGLAPMAFRAAPFFGFRFLETHAAVFPEQAQDQAAAFPFADVRLSPHYPAKSPLADALRLVAPGSDGYLTEKYAFEIETILEQRSQALCASAKGVPASADWLDPAIDATAFSRTTEIAVRNGFGIDVVRRRFGDGVVQGPERLLGELQAWLGRDAKVETAEFEIYGIEETSGDPPAVRTDIRYDIVTAHGDGRHQERVGSWQMDWRRDGARGWKALRWRAGEETVAALRGPGFIDVTRQALGAEASWKDQLLHGSDHWRTVLDGAIGADVYSNNGVAAGDYDNDGFDDFYVCQPAGLPNRLYRNRGDGTFEDVTVKAGVGVLDNTACALFADFDNKGHQDLLVVCGTGPLLFLNRGDGTFSVKRDAFKFASPPQGTFTHAAVADYDRDGRLDIYFCLYMYYLGLDQYHYPIPYYDARNGPPNCLLHNEGDATFVERTEASGLNADNDRYSFACAWGDSNSNGLPDLFVANDFGSSQLYRNNGDGTFNVVSKQAHVEDVGAGMSCCWCDYDNDGHQDIYVPSMWEAAGQRVSQQSQFHAQAPENIRALYQRHARGNALYRNRANGTFENVGRKAGVEMGRWSWCSDFWDFDHDGFPDLYVSNGYISAENRSDLASFFWRQVVAKSPEDATSSLEYERGWNAINELARSDHTWHGYARNVAFVNNRDGTFSEVSGPAGLDFIEDSRSFALADIDRDGRLEVILKNRNAPQLRILHNAMQGIGHSVAFRLRGRQSNRDSIGASVTLEVGTSRQTKYLQAGSGFLAQNSKEMFFGTGASQGPFHATVRWPNGLSQRFEGLPANHSIEIEEGRDTFTARPFAAAPTVYAQPEQPSELEPLPTRVETWLIQPLKAPDFSLPDLAGNHHKLSESRGRTVLLTFWSTKAPASLDQLRLFDRDRAKLSAGKLEVLAVNVDDASDLEAARAFTVREKLSLTVLMASEETAGIYNVVYRHLFDRRRDLAIPVCFLIDREGSIVKVYQGSFNPQNVIEDARTIPDTAEERTRKALPFGGDLYLGSFRRNDYTFGVAMFQHGYLEQAAESFRQVIALKPDDPDAYYNLGTLSLQRNDFDQATEYLKKTLKLRPDYPEAWNNLGMMAAQQGRLDEAALDFEQSLSLRPAFAVALLNLGNVYRRQREFEKAEECLNRALGLQPDNPEIDFSLGMLYAQQNRIEPASVYLEKAITLRPDYGEALNNLGIVFVRAENYAKAEEQFKTGIRLAPQFDQSYLNLARLYAIRNEKEKAKEVLLDLLRVQPQNQSARQALETLQ